MKNDTVGDVELEATLHDARVLYRSLSSTLSAALKRVQAGEEPDKKLSGEISSYSSALNRVLDLEADFEKRSNKLRGTLSGAQYDLDAARREVVERLTRLHAKGGD